jgi:hypothetical protein
MDSNDFIFSDDAAESLGMRIAEADSDALSPEMDDTTRCGKVGVAAISAIGLAVMSVTELFER